MDYLLNWGWFRIETALLSLVTGIIIYYVVYDVAHLRRWSTWRQLFYRLLIGVSIGAGSGLAYFGFVGYPDALKPAVAAFVWSTLVANIAVRAADMVAKEIERLKD